MYIVNIRNINSKNVNPQKLLPLIGGKALGMLRILKAGLNIPETFVVTTDLFKDFLKTIENEKLRKLNKKAKEYIEKSIGKDLNELSYKNFAVRSSGVMEDSKEKSFAGIFKSYLNTSSENLAERIGEVWFSGLGKRVSSYSNTNTWPEMAVIIQPMIDAVYSGVCFSKNPSPVDVRDNDRPLIEVVSGYGEKLVTGEVRPFAFKSLSGNEEWWRDLEHGMDIIEKETGNPVDMEFSVDSKGKLWFLQERPVTILNESKILNLERYRKAYKRTLCSMDIEFLIDGCARYLAPYLELSLNLTEWMVMITNNQDGQQELWIDNALDEKIKKLIGKRIKKDNDYLRRIIDRYEYHHRHILNWKNMLWSDEKKGLKERITDFFEFIIPVNAHYYVPMHIIEALSMIIMEKMKTVDENGEDDFFKITTSGIKTLVQVLNNKCFEIKEKIKDLPENYKDLSPEYKIKIEKIAEDYGFLNCHLPFEQPYNGEEIYHLVKDSQSEDLLHDNRNIINKYLSVPEFSELLSSLDTWLNIRNQQMEYLYYIYEKAQPLFKDAGDKINLTLEEIWNSGKNIIFQALSNNERAILNFNRKSLCLYHDGYNVNFRDDLEIVYSSTDSSNLLKGKTVFGTGKIEGTVKIAFTPEELTVEEDNLIIVTGMTTPDFVPYLKKKASGLITDEGGILCHAAIIAREIKLPSIVGTGIGTELLKDGARVELDLNKGEVKIISYI